MKKLLLLLALIPALVHGQGATLPYKTGTPTSNVACTNGVTGANDYTLISNAANAVGAAGGGTVKLGRACKVNGRFLTPSNVTIDGGHALFTLAAASYWAGGTILSPFGCVDGAHDITFTNFNADLTGAPANVKLVACQGDTDNTTYTRLHFTNNTVLTPGDGVAFSDVSDSTVTGNYIANCAGACIDYWSLGGNAIITDNTVKVGVGAGIGIIYTSFKTDNVTPTNKMYANIAHNYVELDNPSGIGEGIYLQGQEVGNCSFGTTNNAYNHVTGNTIVGAIGQQSLPIWADLCIYYTTIDHNIIIGDGATVNTHFAIGAGGSTVGIMIEDNIAQGYFAPTSAVNEQGVFNNRGVNGSLINNKSFNGSSVVTNSYKLDPTTIVYGNDGGTAGGTGLVNFVSNLAFNGAPLTLVYDLYEWGVPVFLPSSGAFAAGVVTLTTGIPNVNGCTNVTGCYMYFPAGAVCATCGAGGAGGSNPSAAGMYYCQNSGSGGGASTTVFNCFNNTLTSGVPVTIASPTPFTSPGTPAAYTQTTSSLIPLITLTVPGGTIGANGSMYVRTAGQRSNNADTVIQNWTFGGTTIGLAQAASVNWYTMERTVINLGAQNLEVFMGNATSGATDVAFNTAGSSILGLSTNLNQNLVLNCQINTATDQCIIWGGKVQIN